MAEDVKNRLRGAPMVMYTSPYFNVADKHYVGSRDLADALDYIASLERKISALETYLDGPPRMSKSGVPKIAKPQSLTAAR